MQIDLVEYIIDGEDESILAKEIILANRLRKRARTAADVKRLYQIEARRVMAALTGAGIQFDIRYHAMMGCTPHKLVADWNRGRTQKKMAIIS